MDQNTGNKKWYDDTAGHIDNKLSLGINTETPATGTAHHQYLFNFILLPRDNKYMLILKHTQPCSS